MKVSTLIEKLQELPQDAQVLLVGEDFIARKVRAILKDGDDSTVHISTKTVLEISKYTESFNG